MSTCFIHACLIYTLLMLVWCFINAGLPVRRVLALFVQRGRCSHEGGKEHGSIFKVSYLCSNYPYLHSAYLIGLFKQRAMAV